MATKRKNWWLNNSVYRSPHTSFSNKHGDKQCGALSTAKKTTDWNFGIQSVGTEFIDVILSWATVAMYTSWDLIGKNLRVGCYKVENAHVNEILYHKKKK